MILLNFKNQKLQNKLKKIDNKAMINANKYLKNIYLSRKKILMERKIKVIYSYKKVNFHIRFAVTRIGRLFISYWSLTLKKGGVKYFLPKYKSFTLSVYENKSIIFN